MRNRARRPAAQPGSPAAENIKAIVEIQQRNAPRLTLPERVGEEIGRLVGSLKFVAFHLVWFGGWSAWNTFGPARMRFDPYPFGLLTFIVSLESVLIGTFVLMAQNQMSRENDTRDHLNLQVGLLAEQETTAILRTLRRISDHLGLAPDDGDTGRTERLAEDTDVFELVNNIRKEVTPDKT